jgi:uncharacterized membrane protein
MADERALAQFLGWFSIGLGLAQVAAPRQVAQMIGATGDDNSIAAMRLVGVREFTAGVGILAMPKPTGWIWARVAGDAMDLALLGTNLTGEPPRRNKAVMATAAVVGITALDLATSLQLSRKSDGARRQSGIEATEVVTVNRPREELYRYWHDFQNLPRFMHHLESVQTNGDGRSHWKTKGPAGTTVEWDAEIVEDRPNEMIAWRSVEDADVRNSGSVRFVPAPGNRGTEVRVQLRYNPPGGPIGAAIAKLFGEEPSQQVQDELRAFKQVMETGEVVHSDASIYGRPHPAQPPAEKVVYNGTQPVLAGR